MRAMMRCSAERSCANVSVAPSAHKTAVVHDNHALAHGLHFGQDVGGQNNRVVSAEALDEVADLDDLLRVKADGGLVQNEDRRVAEQSLRNADTLLVALRQVADETSVDVVNLRRGDLADMLLAVELDALQLIS